MFSRSSSNTSYTPEVMSARISAHLRNNIMRTPPNRQHHTTSGGDGTVLPLFFSLDSHTVTSSNKPLERLHSSRCGTGSRSDEEIIIPPLDFDTFIISESNEHLSTMSREELEHIVNILRIKNRMLMSAVMLDRESLMSLQENMRETYEAAEKEGEGIANYLTRRMEIIRRQKIQLGIRLRNEEAMKADQEQRLIDLRRSCTELTERLQKEEEVMKLLPIQLQQLQQQRQHVEGLLSEQSASLQQLQELVDKLHIHIHKKDNNNDNEEILVSESLHVDNEEILSNMVTNTNTKTDNNIMLPTSNEAPLPVISKTMENIDPASNSQGMLYYLKRQVSIVETLQQEAYERAEMYKLKKQELEERICQATNERCSNRQSLEGIHQELLVTTATVSELASAAELAMEVEMDRQFHLSSRNGSTNSSSFGFRTPKRTTEIVKGESTGNIKNKPQQSTLRLLK